MTTEETDPATDYEEIDRWDGGVGWLAHPDEGMRRASHALATADGVWVVDPVDADGVDDLVGEFGEVAGVVVLLDRHFRDADELARRHDVAVYVPSWFGDLPDLEAPLRRFDDRLPGTDYRLLRVVDTLGWSEGALYDAGSGTLVVPESVGTASFFTAGDERLGVHPMLRLTPPSALRGLDPERVLVGHGAGVQSDAARALADALDGARRGTPRLVVETIGNVLGR